MNYKYNKGGVLVYKCRRCRELNKNTHIPTGYGTATIISIMQDIPIPQEIKGVPVSKFAFHDCEDGNLGVCDLIGFEYDKEV